MQNISKNSFVFAMPFTITNFHFNNPLLNIPTPAMS